MITVENSILHEINHGMFGLFFEDINYALDGGLHAEMIENRSFEFFDAGGTKCHWYRSFDGLYGWSADTAVSLAIESEKPLNNINPHYLVCETHNSKGYFSNKAYDGIYMTAGQKYKVSFYAAAVEGNNYITVEIRNGVNGKAYCSNTVTTSLTNEWVKYETIICSSEDVRAGAFCIEIGKPGKVKFDFISMMPEDAVCGVFRRDLAETLKEMNPGFLRFPGGCVVEGNNLANMYKWKLSVGKPEERKGNWNRWAVHQNNGHGPYSH